MLYDDYEKFCAIASKKLGENFLIQTNKNDAGFPYYFSRILLKGTVFSEENAVHSKRKYDGIWIDVYPFEKVPKKSDVQRAFFNECRMLDYFVRCKYKVISQDTNDKNSFVKRLIVVVFPKFLLTKIRNALFKKYRNLNDDYLISGLWNRSVQIPLELSCYKDVVLHQFEDTEVFIPEHYHEVLTAFFGDYMQLPPESERVAHHGIIRYDFGKYGSSVSESEHI